MAGADWSLVVGILEFIVALIISVVIYAVKRKFYLIMYLISAAVYIFTICFAIDVFDLSKNWILLLLALSSVLMMLIGWYIAKEAQKHKKSKRKSK